MSAFDEQCRSMSKETLSDLYGRALDSNAELRRALRKAKSHLLAYLTPGFAGYQQRRELDAALAILRSVRS